MDRLATETPDVICRALSVMVADPANPLDRDEREAVLCWLQGLPCDVLILLPDDVMPPLIAYLHAHHPLLALEMAQTFQRAGMKGWTSQEALKEFDSPQEIDFYLTWHQEGLDLLYPLTPQYPVDNGKYFLDFAYPPIQFGIELDGYTFHSDRDAFTRDRRRQREIEALGWRIIRFSSYELYQDLLACVREAARHLDIWKRICK